MRIKIRLDASLLINGTAPRTLFYFLESLQGVELPVNTDHLFKGKFLISSLGQEDINSILSNLSVIDYANYAGKLNEIFSTDFIILEESIEYVEDDERINKKYCNACEHFVNKDHVYCDFCGRDDCFSED